MIRDFLDKSLGGHFLPIQVLQGEAYNSVAMKKKTQLNSIFGRQRSQGLKFALKSTSVVPRCRPHQCTITPWVSDVIDTNIIYDVQPNFLCATPALPSSFYRTRVDPDIFDGIVRFHRNKHSFVDYDKGFFRKITKGPLLPIQVLLGEAYNSTAMKKTQLDSMFGRQRSQGLKFALKSASAVPRCRSHQCTLTPWVSNVIDTNIIEAVQPNFLCATPALPSSFQNTGGPRHL